jgi:hypothetical protein
VQRTYVFKFFRLSSLALGIRRHYPGDITLLLHWIDRSSLRSTGKGSTNPCSHPDHDSCLYPPTNPYCDPNFTAYSHSIHNPDLCSLCDDNGNAYTHRNPASHDYRNPYSHGYRNASAQPNGHIYSFSDKYRNQDTEPIPNHHPDSFIHTNTHTGRNHHLYCHGYYRGNQYTNRH